MNAKVKAFVIAQQEYKDNDMFISLLTSDKVLRVVARGVKKITSKNRVACQLFTYGEYQFSYKSENSLKVLTSTSVIKNNSIVSNDLMLISQLSLIGELITKNFTTDRLFEEFKDLVEYNSCFDFCWIIKEMVCLSGVMPNVDSCHCCANKVVVGFSFDGGFVCQNCKKSYDYILGTEQLKLIYYLFKKSKEKKSVLRELAYDVTIPNLLLEYYLYHQPQNLKSLKFYRKIQGI